HATVTERRRRLALATTPGQQREDAALERLQGLADKALDADGAKLSTLVDYLRGIGVGAHSENRAVRFAERIASIDWLRARLPHHPGQTAENVAVMHGRWADVEQERIVDDFE